MRNTTITITWWWWYYNSSSLLNAAAELCSQGMHSCSKNGWDWLGTGRRGIWVEGMEALIAFDSNSDHVSAPSAASTICSPCVCCLLGRPVEIWLWKDGKNAKRKTKSMKWSICPLFFVSSFLHAFLDHTMYDCRFYHHRKYVPFCYVPLYYAAVFVCLCVGSLFFAGRVVLVFV